MPFALLIVGIVFVISGVRGTQSDLFTLLKGDVTGTNNYFHWIIAILIIGAIGYVPDLEKFSKTFLVLIVIVLFLTNGGFFQNFNTQLFATEAAKYGVIGGASNVGKG